MTTRLVKEVLERKSACQWTFVAGCHGRGSNYKAPRLDYLLALGEASQYHPSESPIVTAAYLCSNFGHGEDLAYICDRYFPIEELFCLEKKASCKCGFMSDYVFLVLQSPVSA